MYIKSLFVINLYSITHHSFVTELQLQMSAPPDIIPKKLNSMQSWIRDIKAWATVSIHKLNDNKTIHVCHLKNNKLSISITHLLHKLLITLKFLSVCQEFGHYTKL